jgi:AraC-like DNA-binding protein
MFKTINPPPNLSKYIKAFWMGSFESNLEKSFTHLAHATTTPQLIFHLEGSFHEVISSVESGQTFDASIYGQSNLYKVFKTKSKKPSILGVQLYPHALPKLLSVPAEALTNETVELQLALGREGRELTEAVFTTRCEFKRVELISTFLEKKLNGPDRPRDTPVANAILNIERCKGRVSISKLVDQSCLSQRQFERNFKELTGFSPKAYLKIVRFESLLEGCAITGSTLTGKALEFGYYDQAHMNHDFRAFTGLSPLQYRDFCSSQFM